MDTCRRSKSVILATVLASIVLASTVFADSIVGSKHDFSAFNTLTTPFAGVWEYPDPTSGFNLVIDEVCVFCHTPHGTSQSVPGLVNAPLWNRTNSPYNPPTTYTYSMYSSATFTWPISAAPTGISAMCMSCHDGVTSIAVNTLLNGPGSGDPIITPNGINPPGAIGEVYNGSVFIGWGPNLGEIYNGMPANTTIALSNDHPISFEWPSSLNGTKLNDPGTIDARLRLFGPSGMRIECATCHTVHDPANVPFLAMPNDNSGMCRSCHIK